MTVPNHPAPSLSSHPDNAGTGAGIPAGAGRVRAPGGPAGGLDSLGPMSEPATGTRAPRPSAVGPWRAPRPAGPLRAVVEVPGSKSESNRALVLAALSEGPSTIRGVLDARDTRLMADALRALGAAVDADALPFTLDAGDGLAGGPVRIDSSGSSQYVSGLLLVGARLPRGLDVEHVGPPVPSAPHIAMTIAMAARHGIDVETLVGGRHWRVRPGVVEARDERIEPDLTNAAAFLAAGVLTGGTVTIAGWPRRSTQPGAAIRDVLIRMGAAVTAAPDGLSASAAPLAGAPLDLHEASELTPVVAALAAVAEGPTTITGVGHIRGHETDRIRAIAAELGRLGVPVRELDDGLVVTGMAGRLDALHPSAGDGLFACHGDHRMAHLGALMGLVVPGVRLDDVGCTAKTMPDFAARWDAMAAAR